MDGGEDSGDVVGRTPSVLENIETEVAVGVNVGMDHFGEEFDGGRIVGVRFFKGEDESESAVFEGRVGLSVALRRVSRSRSILMGKLGADRDRR